MRQLGEIVEKADRAARERREEDRESAQRVVRDRQERNGRGEEDEEPAHRRRPLLAHVMLGSVLADVLAERVAAQELDEPRADEDRNDERYERCDENSTHDKASATISRPTERDPLTSTTSPVCTCSRASPIASAAVAAHASGA